jgi:hypothetical protein
MAGTTSEAAALRGEVETAVLDAVERLGHEGFCKAAIVKPLLGRGTHQATLYRWVDAILASGMPSQHVMKVVKEAAAVRAVRSPDPVSEVVEDLKGRLPIIARLDDLRGGSTINVLERLARVTDDIELLVRHAKTEDGKVRNPRLLLVSLAELRKCLETSVKFYQAMRETAQADRLQDAILDEIAKTSPEVAEAIYRRIDQIAASWMG